MMAKIKSSLLSLRDLFATAWWIFLIVGGVTNSEPFCDSSSTSKGGTGPEALP